MSPSPLRGFVSRWLATPRAVGRALRLLGDVSPVDRALILGTAVLLGAGPLGAAYVTRGLVDALLRETAGGHRLEALLPWFAAELALAVVLLGADRLRAHRLQLLRARLAQLVLQRVLGELARRPLLELERAETHDQLREALDGARYRPIDLVERTMSAVQLALSAGGGLTLLATFAPWAALLLLAALLPILLVETRLSRDAFRIFRWGSPETRRQAALERTLSGLDAAREIRAFDLAEPLLARHQASFDRLFSADAALSAQRAWLGLLVGGLAQLAVAAASLLVLRAALGAPNGVGVLVMYALLLRAVLPAATGLVRALGAMHEDRLYLESLDEVLAPAQRPTQPAFEGRTANPGLQLERVCFRYPGAKEDVLTDVELTIEPGERVALIGANGSGKTTLLQLMLGLLPPSSGRVLLDGGPLDGWDRAALVRRFGVLFQRFERHPWLVGENVGAGDGRKLDERSAWQLAVERARVEGTVNAFPQGLDTPLGKEFGAELEPSGGQWQQLAFARALLRNDADFLLLDEPTANLDPQAERALLDALEALPRSLTVVLSTHRLAHAAHCDRVVVLERGRLVEDGTFSELARSGGTFATMLALQLGSASAALASAASERSDGSSSSQR